MPWFFYECRGFGVCSMKSANKKPSLAATFPRCSAFVAKVRRELSPDGGTTPGDINVNYMEEDGRSVGNLQDESRFKSISLRDICLTHIQRSKP